MAEFLNISVPECTKLYVRKVNGRLSLVEKRSPDGYDCVFLHDKKCRVYGARPTQCRTFPWWPENLQSKESWQEAATSCEGINDDAPVVSYLEIKRAQQG